MDITNSETKFKKTRSKKPIDEETRKLRKELKNEKARAKYHAKIQTGGEELRKMISDKVIQNRKRREEAAGIVKKKAGRPIKVN